MISSSVILAKEIENNSQVNEEEDVYLAVEQQAEFPGGNAALMKWLGTNMRYPEEAQKNDIQGRVIVKMIIEKDGTVSNATIVKSVDKDLDNEALRLVKIMPRWQPGKVSGVAVRSYYSLPLSFILQSN